MNLAALSLRNVQRSARSYRLWFVSIAVAAAALYLFQAARFDPVINGLVSSKASLTAGMDVASIILAGFTAVFMAYSAAFFVRGRSREIGLYRLFGVRRGRIALLLLAENLITGAAALAAGLAAGIALSKLFLLGLARLLDLDANPGLVADPAAISRTALGFGAIILAASAVSAAGVFRSRLSEVFRRSQTASRAWRIDPFLGLIALPLLGFGYTWALSSDTKTILVNFFLVSGLTIVATWAFARGAARLGIGLVRRSSLFYRGHRMIALGNLDQRLGGNARTFTVIAIVSTVAMSALGVGLNAKLFLETNLATYLPHELSLTGADPAVIDRAAARLADAGAAPRPADTLPCLEARLLNNQIEDGYYLPARIRIYPAGAFLDAARAAERGAEQAAATLAALAPGQAAVIEPDQGAGAEVLGRSFELALGAAAGTDAATDAKFLLSGRIGLPALNAAGFGKGLVVPDAVWEELAVMHPDAKAVQHDYDLGSWRAAQPVIAALQADTTSGVAAEGRETVRDEIRGANVYLFSGCFLCLVFLVCSCSILHFKQLMDAREDRPRLAILRAIGLDDRTERRAARLQVAPIFAIPMVLAMAHSAVALATMGKVLHMDVGLTVAVVLAGYVLIFGSFGVATVRSYRRETA